MSRVVHFEIGAQDTARAVRFYSNVFGWKLQKWDGPQEYWLATTGEQGAPGIDGAIMPAPEGKPTVINTIDVADVDEVTARITANGGEIALPKMAVPGIGWLVYFKDTEGNVSGIMQSDPSAR
jgi:predicted enzyme related to lactoylglutathione lyase